MGKSADLTTWTDEELRREHDAGEWFANHKGLTPEQEKRMIEVEREMSRRDSIVSAYKGRKS